MEEIRKIKHDEKYKRRNHPVFTAGISTEPEKCQIEAVVPQGAILLYRVSEQELRPGGTVSGPTMMTLADLALYIAILGEIGLVGLAVTTNLNINFLRKPSGGVDLRGKVN